MDRNQVILSKKIVANKAAKNYIKEFPNLGHLKSDLQAAAMVGIIKAVDLLLKQNKPIDDAYLMVAAKRSMLETIDDLSNTLPIPRSTKSLAKKNGDEIEQTFVGPLPDDFDCIDDRGPSLSEQVSECCANDTERTIVRMLAANYNQRAIAKHLQIDFRRVSEIIDTIKQRFDNDEDGPDEEYEKVPVGFNGKCPGVSKKTPCGKPVARWANANYCEDCDADICMKFHGRSQSVNTLRSSQPSFTLSA